MYWAIYIKSHFLGLTVSLVSLGKQILLHLLVNRFVQLHRKWPRCLSAFIILQALDQYSPNSKSHSHCLISIQEVTEGLGEIPPTFPPSPPMFQKDQKWPVWIGISNMKFMYSQSRSQGLSSSYHLRWEEEKPWERGWGMIND